MLSEMTSALATSAGIAVLLLAASVTAIEPVSHYYLGFFMSYAPSQSDQISILIKTTDTHEVQYSIEAPGVAYYYNGSLSAGGEVILSLPTTVAVASYNDQDKGIYLKVYSSNVTVIGQNLDEATGDSFLALPIVELDDVYVYYGVSVPIAAFDSSTLNSSILIVGAENDTMINLTVTQSVDIAVGNTVTNLIPGWEYSFVINRLQTVYIGSVQDLSGTKIVTDRPVSVFSGHECGNVPPNVSYCSFLAEQIPPTALWGKEFYFVPLAGKRSYTVKILAAYIYTIIDIYCNNTMESHTIGQAGEFVNKILQVYQYCAVYSNKEVLVVQLSHGGNEDNDYGDPMMTLVPATNQYLNKFDFSTIRNPLEPGYNHHVNIIVMEQYYKPNMIYLMSGGVNRSLITQRWVPIRVKNTIKAYGLIMSIPEGTAQIFHTDASAQMMTIVYGFGTNDGYGHIGGMHMSTVSGNQSPHIYLRSDDSFEPNTIGQRQEVVCSISVPPDVDPDTIELGWLDEDDITNETRVTVYKLTNDSFDNSSNSSTIAITTVIQFDPLLEDDEGTYSCFYSKMNESALFTSIRLHSFIIPTPLVQITTFDNETLGNIAVGDLLKLNCIVTAVRGISSSVNIIWTTGDIELRRVDDITAGIENDSAIYTDSFEISSLSAIDNGREYQCTVMINATQPVNSSDQFIPIFPAPVCFNTTYCGGESVGNNLLSYEQCCFELSATSFASSGQCLLCPITDSIISFNGTTDFPRIYQPLILQCNANIIKSNTTTVDIIWTTNNKQVRRVNNVTASSSINSSSVYNDSFIIPSLNISDIGRVYECEVLINSVLPTSAKTDILIPIPGSRCFGHDHSVIDVVFVIDSSGSIGADNFQLIRDFTANITTELFRSSSMSAVAVILFESTARIWFNLKTYTSLRSLLSAINRLPYRDGSSTDTDEALRLLLSSAKNGRLQLRTDSSKIAIVITDGQSGDRSATLSAAAALHASKLFDVYAVGISGADLDELEGIASSPEFVFYTSFLNLSQIQEKILPQLCTSSIHNITLQPNGFDQNIVGQRQEVICSVSVPPNTDPDDIELGWLNENEIITSDSRISIISFLVNDTMAAVIRFDPLVEDDEDEFTCYTIINGSFVFGMAKLQNFKIPIPRIQITIPEYENFINYETSGDVPSGESGENVSLIVTVGDPLPLNCTVTAVRGISSSVNIIWSTGGSVVRRVDDITADIVNDSAIYTDSFEISSLSAIDNGREYQCTVMINAPQPVFNSDQFVVIFDAPVCFNTTHCGGESFDDSLISYEQCCFELFGVSFASPGQCMICPKSDCTTDTVKDIVFVIDTSYDIGSYLFQMIREFADNITISLKLNSPESSVGVILFDYSTSILFNLEEHTKLLTLSPAINPGLPYNSGFSRDTAASLNLLLSSAQNGSLGIRNETSNIAIVITGGRSDSNYATQSAAAALHAAKIFDVYAIGFGSADINELNAIATDSNFVHFINIFNILDFKESQFNVIDQLCSLPIPRISLQPSRKVVGEMQNIICLITITSAIDPNSVELTWTRNDINIMIDNRVTIIPTNVTENPSSFTYTTTVQFAYLMEGDEGNYTCKVSADNMVKSHSVVLQNLTIPSPVVEVFSIDTVEYGQAATLECNVTAARGIISRVDIIWSNGLIVKAIENVTANIVNNSAIYSDQLVTSPLLVNDSGRVYHCIVSIQATFEITSSSGYTLDFAVPSCYIRPSCIGEPIDKVITFSDCCKSYGIAFDLDGRCRSCPSTNCSSPAVRDVVFVIDTKRYRFEYLQFQLIRELVESITTALKIASPETLFGLITYSRYSAYYKFDILTHTSLSTLLSAIDSELNSSYSSSYSTNIPQALRLLLSGGREGGYLNLRNKISNVAIVISDGYASSFFSLRSAASALHSANIFDVYAVGVGNHRYSDLRLIASDPSFIFSTNSFRRDAQWLEQNVIRQFCSTPTPRIFVNDEVLQRPVLDANELVCLVVLSSTAQPNSVNLTWNFTSNDTRARVIPTAITSDDSIGISYTTVIQFSYLMDGAYTCTVMIDGDSAESHFNFINYNISIISNPSGFVIGDNNSYEYFNGTDVILTCSVFPTPPVERALSWGCSTGCFAEGQTMQTVSVLGLDEGDSGILNCSITINGIQYHSKPFGLQVINDESCRLDKVTCITEFYPSGLSENDTALPRGDDVTSPLIILSKKFYFYGQSINFVYVGSNGIISLNTSYNSASSRALPINGHMFIAPYWYDVDTRGTGEIYYRQTTNSTLLARAAKEIKAAFSTSQNVNITNLFIVTWNAVGYYSRGTDKTNTFQCVLATSATESFVIFLYADGRIQWANRALAGLNAGDGINYETVPGSLTSRIATISRTTNVGVPGIWMFKVDEDIDECEKGTDECDHNCTNTDESYYCTCMDGYELESDNQTCTDIDECEEGTDECDQNCTNTNGSYYCTCMDGYKLESDNQTCTDINECELEADGCQHICNNVDGSFYCTCNPGYTLRIDSKTCTAVPDQVPSVMMITDSITLDDYNVTLTLNWGEPFNNFDPIVNYTVSCSGDVTCPPNFTTTDNTTRSYTITNLTQMTNYTFSVVATNSIGSGKAGVVVITTPSCIPCNITRNVRVRRRRAVAIFSSNNPRTTFICKLDGNNPESCTSPMTYRNLSRGRHRIVVIAKCPCKAGRDVKRFRIQIR